VAFGLDLASGIEQAVGARAGDDDFEERLTGTLDQFVDCRWPRLYLAAGPLGEPPEAAVLALLPRPGPGQSWPQAPATPKGCQAA
jgi:hypothetical protein